jgi:beta-galactosidase
MNRRTFVLGSAGAAAVAGALRAQSNRDVDPTLRTYDLNRNWLFTTNRVHSDPKDWSRVDLPHSNVVLPWHSFDDKSYEIVSFYRRQFRAPKEWAGKRIFVDFDGAMTASKVSLKWNSIPSSARTFPRSAATSTISPSAAFTAMCGCVWFRTRLSKTYTQNQYAC